MAFIVPYQERVVVKVETLEALLYRVAPLYTFPPEWLEERCYETSSLGKGPDDPAVNSSEETVRVAASQCTIPAGSAKLARARDDDTAAEE